MTQRTANWFLFLALFVVPVLGDVLVGLVK
jgi:hypothetical protein